MKTFAFLFSIAVSGTAMAGISGTAHDLSNDGFSGSDAGQLCIYCHTPHNGAAAAPLWNRANSVATYQLYNSGTTNYDVAGTTIDGSSVLCLSCHDGTVALNSVSHGNITGNAVFMTGNAAVGTDLRNDHPVSFDYQYASSRDTGLFPHDNVNVAPLLENGKVQCSSCHDVHDNQFQPFLRSTNAGSALCLKCHNK